MAILSNGKFYGFLCSVKETGRKLANGVKEYVEDFVSGFSGHGWKLWEYVKGKWKLEIDTIVVRETMLVFEMLISKVRAIIGAQAITQGHGKVKSARISEDGTEYLIELEDEDVSIVAHDFVRCQTFVGDKKKLYHVEVSSVDVETKTLHVPLSEFDKDESGNILNVPAAGDELIQFGNSQNKARQSAIYMHADETGQPAIDVMFDIDSKNWEGKVKVCVGGNIPGTNNKGFYCVNGMIRGVSEDGTVVYQINPDGSGFLGSGGIKWENNGYPQFSGTILVTVEDNNVWKVTEEGKNLIGNPIGKHIEISGKEATVKMFNTSNEERFTLMGDNKTRKDFWGDSSDEFTPKNLPVRFNVYETQERNLQKMIFEDFKTGSLDTYFHLQAQIKWAINCFAGGKVSICIMLAGRSLITGETQNEELYNTEVEKDYRDHNWEDIDKKIKLLPYHSYEAWYQFKAYSNTDGEETYIIIERPIIQAYTVKYNSAIFSNGLILGDSNINEFSVFNTQNKTKAEGDLENTLEMLAVNPTAGYKITRDNMFIKDSFFKLPLLYLAIGDGWINKNSGGMRVFKSFDGKTKYLTVENPSTFTMKVKYPEEWRSVIPSDAKSMVFLQLTSKTGGGYLSTYGEGVDGLTISYSDAGDSLSASCYFNYFIMVV